MIGTEIGGYRIISKLGEGGMGTVYVAEHALLGRKAAVKVLLKELTEQPSIVRRFINEARATAQIVHPGVIRIFDFNQLSDGTAYILMELLEGETLLERVRKRGPLPLEQALTVVRQVAEALGAAHALRVVHRDLKPDNIFLVSDPTAAGGEQVKILDFGIAKVLDAGADAPQTKAGTILGTPMYMSPEQCQAVPDIDARADLYALGCIFFFLLCGRPPFVDENLGQLLAAHLFTPPPAPSAFVAAIPAWIDAIVARLLAKAREDRFQSTNELVAALDHARSEKVPLRTASTSHAASDEATVILPSTAGLAQATALAAQLAPPLPTPSPTIPANVPAASGTPVFGHGRADAPRGTMVVGGEADPRALAIPQPQSRRVGTLTLLGSAFGITLALGLGSYFLVGRRLVSSDAMATPDPPAAVAKMAASAASTRVTFTLDSDPPGAAVSRDGAKVCVTPCKALLSPAPGEADFVFSQEGYESQTLTLRADRDGTGRVTLAPARSR